MALSAHERWSFWIRLTAVVPLFLLLLGLDAWIGAMLWNRHVAAIRSLAARARSAVESALLPDFALVHGIARWPAVVDLLRSAEGGRRGASAAEIQKAWPTLGSNSPVVSEILHNTVAEGLRRVTAECPSVVSLVLTDGEGVVLAASSRPDGYDLSRTTWWQHLRLVAPGAVVSEGIGDRGRLGVALGIPTGEAPPRLAGALRMELELERILGRVRELTAEGEWAVSLAGQGVLYVAGTRWVHERGAARVAKGWRDILDCSEGWGDGLRFRAEDLECGVTWARAPRVVAWRAEARVPGRVLGAWMGMGALTLVILAGVVTAVGRVLDRKIFAPAAEVMEAGEWALRTALGRPGAGGPVPPRTSEVQKELDTWLRQMRQDMEDEIARRTSDVQRDLELAKDFQMAYVERPYPKIPAVHIEGRLRLEFYHRYQPAMALGGDFFDLLTLAPDCGGVFIADVMGHGTRSALITSILRTLLGDLLSQGRNARHFLTELNKQFCGLLKSVPNPLFASAFYFVADTTARMATYSSAGHPAPFHIRRNVGRLQRLDVPEPHGCALGLLPKETYTGGHVRLLAGDAFVFFTDGLYEAHNRAGEEFGIARMEGVLRDLMYKDLRQILDGLMQALQDFIGDEPLADDVCLVGVEVTTAAAPPA